MPVDSVGTGTLTRVVEYNGLHLGDRPFIESGPLSITYGRFARAVIRVANGLRALGIRPGNHVMLYLPNCPEYLVALFGILRAGCVYVTCSTLYKEDEVRYQLEHSGAAAVVADSAALAWLREIVGQVEQVRHLIPCEPDRMEAGDAPLNRMMAEASTAAPGPHPGPADHAFVMYTSGTTARPKGVLYRHGNFFLAARNIANGYHYTRFDRVLHYFPLYHALGGMSLLGPAMLRGATIIMIPKFTSSRFAEILATQRITFTALNATHVKMLLAQPPSDFERHHSLYRVQFGLQLDTARREEFQQRFGDVRLVDAYGLTEANGITTIAPFDSLWRPGTVGLPLPGYEIKIVDDGGREVDAGAYGEILIHSSDRFGLTPGYFHDPDATASLLDDAWLHTGDVGQVDEDGFLWFLERQKDMIKRGGLNVAAAEVERVLLEHPSIREAAVVGVPDPVREEAVVAFIVLRQSSTLSASDTVSFCAQRLADYKVPQSVLFTDALPENFLGKIDKRRLRQLAATQVAAPERLRPL